MSSLEVIPGSKAQADIRRGKQSTAVDAHSDSSWEFCPDPEPEVCKFVWTVSVAKMEHAEARADAAWQYHTYDKLCIMGVIGEVGDCATVRIVAEQDQTNASVAHREVLPSPSRMRRTTMLVRRIWLE